MNLPETVGSWVRPDVRRRITADDHLRLHGRGGELYLAYRFDHLDVFEYKAADASSGTILVEMYSMRTPDDAFGLLSNDWGGEALPFDARSRKAPGRGRHRPVARSLRRAAC